ncbi:MAG: RloB family protein [Bacteroidales bacterium]|nr:RloB family protein [Bacteroidales bacterium]
MDREIKQEKTDSFFADASQTAYEYVDAIRDMHPQYPFIISGGKKTERWYFKHINDLTEYKFIVRPQFFGDESNYTVVFRKNIETIKNEATDAQIYCVFDWDTIFDSAKNQTKHDKFCNKIKPLIDNGSVVLCPSMPCIEYWFFLHFEDSHELIKNCKGLIEKKMKEYTLRLFDIKGAWKDVFKKQKLIEPNEWVKKLLEDGKLDLAIARAKDNIPNNASIPQDQSFSFVYKIFDEYMHDNHK